MHNFKNIQASAVKHIVSNIYNIPLIEAPTGFGKTHVLFNAAKHLVKSGHKVIISTPNNKLAIDGQRTALEHSVDMNIGFIIGASNYIDLNKYQNCKNSKMLEEYIELESLLLWEETFQNSDFLLFDDFDEMVVYKDVAFSGLVSSLIVKDSKLSLEEDFDSFDLTYTNHFYLLYRAVIARNIDLSEYIVLFDEIHELPAVAETVLQNKFSPFYLKNTLHACLKELMENDDNFTGRKSLLRDLSDGVKITYDFMDEIMSAKKHIGEFADASSLPFFVDSIKSLKNEKMKSLSARMAKLIKNKSFEGKRKQIFNSSYNELKELSEVLRSSSKMENGNSVSVYFSPSKGYPTYLTSIASVSSILKFEFWEKIKGGAGVSATLNTTTDYHDIANKKFAYTRLGINHKEAIEIKTFDRPFKKDNIKIIQKPIELYSNNDDDIENLDLKRWAKDIALHVSKTYNKRNTMVLVGSFAEAEAVGAAIAELLPNENLTTANRNLKTINGVKRFVAQGGILIGTRNYGTGLSLDGKKLEMLYISKLPYPIITSKKWIELKEKSYGLFWLYFNNEMLTLFRQYLGRLQRTEYDVGEIHFLDARGIKKTDSSTKRNNNLLRLIRFFLLQYGVEVETKELKSIKTIKTTISDKDDVDYFADYF